MKIMIVSDSHSMPKNDLLELFSAHKVDCYIHCGDIFMTYQALDLDHFYIVRGNNDRPPLPETLTITLNHIRFFITHGHLFDIDYTRGELEAYAKENNIDVVCFGHTHDPVCYKKEKTLFINPGSVTYPRGRYRYPTYCLLETSTMEVEFYNARTHEKCNPFEKKEKKSFFGFFKKKK